MKIGAGFISSFIDKSARFMALLGGIVLCVLVMITCLSIMGRALNSFAYSDFASDQLAPLSAVILKLNIGAIPGDFELIEAGMAFVIFAFLPLCQHHYAHAKIDLVTHFLNPRLRIALDLCWQLLYGFVMVLIVWKLYDGMIGKKLSGQTSFILEYKLWIAYGLSFGAAMIAMLTALLSIFNALRGIIND